MTKSYEGHESEYKRMKSQGVDSWGKRPWAAPAGKRYAIDPDTRRFLSDALAQRWMPGCGRILEAGCGTGRLLRWFHRKGFTGLGIDVSRTAITLARQHSPGQGLQFQQGDLCGDIPKRWGKFDVVVDALCLHCLTTNADRLSFLGNLQSLLNPGGALIILSMCAPVYRPAFKKQYSQLLRKGIVYSAISNGKDFEDSVQIKGRDYLPIRAILSQKQIVMELRQTGFVPRLIRFNHCSEEDPVSYLCVAAAVNNKCV